ncbi:hypothetical protein D187_008937 [Cystobacter fuscus DSM 2262]|uniref:Uncharacterized protein n=1 Tax=Cystobacter fuscus (strain ATCC 25194 / DSM 2262 / NBRC 100088 / M29) TaxID=1242864 RepID=S9QN93_CYSF2|nr:hypothetical protein D187_008937 [Cystobacter fuscus DSM 2262]
MGWASFLELSVLPRRPAKALHSHPENSAEAAGAFTGLNVDTADECASPAQEAGFIHEAGATSGQGAPWGGTGSRVWLEFIGDWD